MQQLPSGLGHALLQTTVGVAVGAFIVAAYRDMRRRWPAMAMLVGAGVLLRSAMSLGLFWLSYLGLPVLADLQDGQGFWRLAPDARLYFFSAADAAERGLWTIVDGSASPAYVRTLAVWMKLVGISPASGLFLNLVCYVLICALVIRIARREGALGTASVVVSLVSFTLSPALLLVSAQSLKDAFFVTLIAIACVGWLGVAVPMAGGAGGKGFWPGVLVGLGVLSACVYLIAGVRPYYALFVWGAAASAFVILAIFCTPRQRWRNALTGVVGIVLFWAAFMVGAGPYYYALYAPGGFLVRQPVASTLRRVDAAREAFALAGGGTNIVVRRRRHPAGTSASVALTPGTNSVPIAMTEGMGNQTTQTLTSVYAVAPTSAAGKAGDYDGDGKADPAVFLASTGTWYEVRSLTGSGYATAWGLAADLPVPGDYDGDGKTDEAVYRPSSGTWFVRGNSSGAGVGVAWGLADDVPVPADYDGDGKTDVAVYRPSTGVWLIVQSSTSSAIGIPWGVQGDVPVPADFDGDGKADPTVFRPSSGAWYQLRSTTGVGHVVVWGLSGDVPLAGDYDGDGKADPTVFRASTGMWYELRSTTGAGVGVQWGTDGDVPIVGDYDGDRKADPTVFRPSTSTWYQLRSTTDAGYCVLWGAPGGAGAQTGASPDALERVWQVLVGAAALFVPVSLLKALSIVDVAGGRGLLFITDVDTVFFDLTLAASLGVLLAARKRVASWLPLVWFAGSLALFSALAMAYVVTNFGTMFRLRLVVAAPMWILPVLLVARRAASSASPGPDSTDPCVASRDTRVSTAGRRWTSPSLTDDQDAAAPRS